MGLLCLNLGGPELEEIQPSDFQQSQPAGEGSFVRMESMPQLARLDEGCDDGDDQWIFCQKVFENINTTVPDGCFENLDRSYCEPRVVLLKCGEDIGDVEGCNTGTGTGTDAGGGGGGSRTDGGGTGVEKNPQTTSPTTSTLAPTTTSTLAPTTTSTLAPATTSTLAPATTSTLAPATTSPTTSQAVSPTAAPIVPKSTATTQETAGGGGSDRVLIAGIAGSVGGLLGGVMGEWLVALNL